MSRYSPLRSTSAFQPDPGLVRWMKSLVVVGVLLVLLFPAARSQGYWLGWMPLWLVGMPLVAWWGLYRFRLPAWPMLADNRRSGRRRLRGQARRCNRVRRAVLAARVA